MTDIPISGLPNAAAIQGSELIPVVQAGTTVQTTAASVLRGLEVVSGIDISNQSVTATGASTAQSLANIAALIDNLPPLSSAVADFILRVNSLGTAFETRSPAQTLADISGLGDSTVALLATSLPANANLLWNNGGLICVS